MQKSWGLSCLRNNKEVIADSARREVLGNEARETAAKSSLVFRREKWEPLRTSDPPKNLYISFY